MIINKQKEWIIVWQKGKDPSNVVIKIEYQNPSILMIKHAKAWDQLNTSHKRASIEYNTTQYLNPCTNIYLIKISHKQKGQKLHRWKTLIRVR